MPGTTSAALPSFSHDQLHETDAAKWKGGGFLQTRCPFHHLNKECQSSEERYASIFNTQAVYSDPVFHIKYNNIHHPTECLQE